MTITGLYTQNLTLNFNTSSSSSSLLTPAITNQKVDADTPATAATTAVPGIDTVSISAEAIGMQAVVVTVTLAAASAPAAAPTQAAPAPAEASRPEGKEPARGDALFEALDADGDGTVTKQEFVDGSRELLQNSRRHGRGHDHHREGGIEGGERPDHGSSRLTRRLERLFDRVDANGDGGVAKSELVGALERRGPTRAVTQPSTPIEQPAPVATPVAEPLSIGRGLLVDSTPRAEATPAAEPVSATGAPVTTNGQRQTATSDAPPAGSFMTITQITITVAIQQYTAVSGSPEPSNTLRAAA
jgi:hypothetical protein